MGKLIKLVQVLEVNKICFELCVFEWIVEELSIGDLFIFYSEIFDDYWEQMIIWEEYEVQLFIYCEEVGFVVGDIEFIIMLKKFMEMSCWKVDS